MKRALAALVSCAALAACVPTPSTTPAETALEANHVGLGATPAPAIAEDWWKAFNDRALDAVVDRALADNPSLHAALARMHAAQAVLSENQASFWPQLTFDGQEQRERFSKNYIIPPPFGGKTDWIGTIGANLSWSIDIWGKQADEIDKARETARAAELDHAAARLALAGAVVENYIAIARGHALTVIARQAAADRASLLKLFETRRDAGLENDQAVKDAEAQLAEANEVVTRAVANHDVLIHALAALTGQGAESYATLPSPVEQPETALALPATLPADLLARRPDILAAQARIDAAMSGREAASKAFYPDIDLIGTAGWAAIGLAPMFSASALQYGAGPALHLPIFDAGKLRAEYAGATASLDEAVADYNGAVLNAVRETSDALTQLHAVDAQQADDTRALSAAEASYRLAQTRYRSGLDNRLVLLEAENTLLAARQNHAELDAATVTSRVTLVMAIGGGYAAHAALAQNASSSGEATP